MDPLVPIPRDVWPAFREEFTKNWPFGITGYYLLDIQMSHPSIGMACNFMVFSPYGDMSHGLIAFSTKGVFREIIIAPTSKNTEKLFNALLNTKLIDWRKEYCLSYCDSTVLNMLPKLLPQIGVSITRDASTIKHYLSKKSPLYELECPPRTYTGPLKMEHIPQVDNAWVHRYETSHMFFELLINNGLTYGLFSTENNNLLAWITICEAGFLTHLYCEEDHRGKGYAEYVVKFASNDLLKKGYDVFCYIVDENYKSMKLFRKLGFEIIGRGVWTFIKNDTTINIL